MGLGNCSECGKLAVLSSNQLCPQCQKDLQEIEDKVMEFIRDHDKPTIKTIHDATGIGEKVIIKLMKSGRIISGERVDYPCESCGSPIQEGRFCVKCSHGLLEQAHKMNEASKKTIQPTGRERMYTK